MNKFTIMDAEWSPLEIQERNRNAAKYSRKVRRLRAERKRSMTAPLLALWGSVLSLLVG